MNLFAKLVRPRLPRVGIALDKTGAALASLDHGRGAMLVVRRAGHIAFADETLKPSFADRNIENKDELVGALGELAASVGMRKRERWSIGLPEATTRTTIITLESAPAARGELEEMLGWKIERAFGLNADELHTTRRKLSPDARGRARYIVAGVRRETLAEYEDTFATLGWHAGLVLPRQFGEAWWLMRDRAPLDSLLVSSHTEGFTAMLVRGGEPLIVRDVACDEADKPDEFYRLLLFYRDRLTGDENGGGEQRRTIERLLIVGRNGLSDTEASSIIADTLQSAPKSLDAADLRLTFPESDIDFHTITAPAGLAALAWS
jgi:hypothetical protein